MRETPRARSGASLATGPRRSRTCPSRSTCRATVHVRRCRAIGARAYRSSCLRSCTQAFWSFRGRAERACSWCCRPALAALLTRLGAGNDIPIGSPIAGRTDSALDDLVGFFVNTLVLRTDTSGNPSFRELVARVRAGNLSAYSHQDLPFERLVEVINPARSLSRHPLFQVMLALQNTAEVKLELDGLSCGFERVATSSAKFDLSVSLGEERGADGAPAGIGGVVEYATDLFDRASVEALTDRLVRLLEAAVADPERAIGSLDILAPDERAIILRDWNDTARAIRARHLAASCSPRRWPARLTRSRWCTRMRASPMASSTGVPTSWRITCAGSASVPRWWWGCARSARPRCWSGSWASSRPAAPICRSIPAIRPSGSPSCWKTPARRCWSPNQHSSVGCPRMAPTSCGSMPMRPPSRRSPPARPTLALDPHNPAYVIYTSGSTGTPKGVVGTHDAMANRIAAQTAIEPFAQDDVCCQKTSIGFVDSIFETLGPLSTGTPLVVVSDAASKDPDKLTSAHRARAGDPFDHGAVTGDCAGE